MRAFHTYLGYAIRLEGELNNQQGTFSIGIGKTVHAKHQFKMNDVISGDCLPVPDPAMEPVEYYKVSKLKVISQGATGSYPTKGFANITKARKRVSTFAQWYNHEHRHSRLNFVTPQQRHTGKDKEILKKRRQVYEKAKAAHPESCSGAIRDWTLENEVCLNPERLKTDKSKEKTGFITSLYC